MRELAVAYEQDAQDALNRTDEILDKYREAIEENPYLKELLIK